MTEDDFQANIDKVSQENDADIFLITGPFEGVLDRNVIKAVRQNKSKSNAILLLSTLGGDADIAYRIARCFQELYKDGQFIVFVPDVCKSAGTLVVLGADQIIMSRKAQLGPLDVQLGKPDEIGKSISGLTPVQSLEFLQQRTFELFEYYFLELITRSRAQITTKTSSEIATKLTIGMFQPIYSQLDPLRLGEYQRNMMIAEEYGLRLSKNSKNLKEPALQRLINDYPSHSFIIDRQEAKELFINVRCPDYIEESIAIELSDILLYGLYDDDPKVYYLAPSDVSEKEKENEKATNENTKPNGSGNTETQK